MLGLLRRRVYVDMGCEVYLQNQKKRAPQTRISRLACRRSSIG